MCPSLKISRAIPPLNIVLVNTWRVVNAKGGAEKVFCDMANALTQRGHKVTAVCFDKNRGLPGFHMDKRVCFVNAYHLAPPVTLSKLVCNFRALSFSRKRRKEKRANLLAQRSAQKLGEILLQTSPDVIVSFQAETTALLKKVVKDTVPIVTMLHSHPDVYSEKFSIPDIKVAVESSSIVQVLRPEYVSVLLKYLPTANIKVIPNCVPQFEEFAELKGKTIVNIGRISPEKRQILLLEAFAMVQNKFPDWNLELWGEMFLNPTYTKDLKERISSLGIGSSVQLCGTTDDIPSLLKRASVFAFPSKFEGFPLALTEAMSMGLPAIGDKACPAVNTLIRDGYNGLLYNATPEALADSLEKLMSSIELRKLYGRRAKEDMKEYSPDRIWNEWEALLYSLSDSNSSRNIKE